MKIIICGKGGAGKSAVSVMLARALAKKGSVYLIDADESNRRLGNMLGTATPKTLTTYLGGRKEISAKKDQIGNIKLGELPPEYRGMSSEGISLISVGKIEQFGEGCACAFGALSRILLQHLSLAPNEYVVVDAEAGVEHLGRGIEAGIDIVVSVVDPTMESVTLARFVSEETTRLGKRHVVVLNKITPELEARIKKLLRAEGLSAACVIPPDPVIFESSLDGGVFKAGIAQARVDALVEGTLFH